MTGDDRLRTGLLDLAHNLERQGIPLILGGGYGLYLKQLHLQNPDAAATVIPFERWPAPRATNDLDLFLRPEIVTSTERMLAIRGVLESLDYAVIQGCEYMQFINPQGVKIDLLTGPLGELESKAKRRQDDRRIGPTPTAKLHAHRTDEAIGFQVDATEIRVNGMLSDGAAYDAVIRIPQAFTFLMMKLFAFRDRNREGEKDDARHHALDLYRTVAMLSEEEFERAMGMGAKHRSNPKVAEAGRIRQEYFGEPMGLGVLRIREHRLLIAEETVAPFLSALARILRFAQDA